MTNVIIKNKELKRTLKEVSELLKDVESFFAGMGHTDIEKKIRDMAKQMAEPFYIIVAGEYNSGKSSFINALLGKKILRVGPTPTTHSVVLLTHGDSFGQEQLQEHMSRVTYPLDALKEITLVDTPGTNSIFVEHETIIENFIHRAELVIFITSSDRPLTESERRFIQLLKGKWGRKVIIVLNKIDLKTEEELNEIIPFIEKNCYKLLGFDPKVIALSSLMATTAKANQDQELLRKSNVGEIEDFIFEKMDFDIKMELKSLSPLRFLTNVFADLKKDLETKIARYNSEIAGIERLEARLKSKREDMQDYSKKYKLEIESAFSRLKERLDTFLGYHMTTRALMASVFSREKIGDKFKKEMSSLSNPLHDLDRVIDDAVDYITRNNRALWEIALDYKKVEQGTGDVESLGEHSFEDRKNELQFALKEHSREYREFDLVNEADRIRAVAQGGLVNFLAMEGAAVAAIAGFGYLLTFFLPAAIIMVGAMALAGIGFTVIPHKRKVYRTEISKRIDNLSDRCSNFTISELNKAIDRVIEDIENTVACFRDVRWSEREICMKHLAELNRLSDRVRGLLGKSSTELK
ncbi:MAG TPA: dynamin family protein [Candidatus Avalokitesvara rifleensis]|uniref:dynamin family protein n=1 Tax=Candidatus Avalokitesvara rifleensis TaxID=3367620 RepID=UPI002712987E|nr:dynamin family protein [Candidatus Brocadiales bacterium]